MVGAHTDDHSPGVSGANSSSQGAAYVFVRSGNTWSQQAKLTASDAAAGDHFGFSVSVSGHTTVVGADLADLWAEREGAAYVFVRGGTTWSQQAKLTAGDADAYDHFGHSVALSGDTAVVGAVSDDKAGPGAGAAYVSRLPGTLTITAAEATATAGGATLTPTPTSATPTPTATALGVTSVGIDVVVSGPTGETITFATVSVTGQTTVTLSSTPPGGAPVPPGVQVIGAYRDIVTTATISGTVQVCLPFTSTELPAGTSAGALVVVHFEVDVWVMPAGQVVDVGAGRACAQVDSLSPFALAVSAPTPTPATPATYDGYMQSLTPLAWWKLDEASGDLANRGSLAGSTGAAVGGPLGYREPGPSSAIPWLVDVTPGSQGWITVPDRAEWRLDGPFTLLAWVQYHGFDLSNPDLANPIIAQDSGGGFVPKWGLAYDAINQQLTFVIYEPGVGGATLRSPGSPLALAPERSYFVALTRGGAASDTYTFYLDGVAVGTVVDGRALPEVTHPLELGRAEGFRTSGQLGQVAILPIALDATALGDLHTLGRSNVTVPPTATPTSTPTPTPTATPTPSPTPIGITAAGTDVVVSDPGGASITFALVTVAGQTTVTQSSTPPGGASVPPGVQVIGAYRDIVTTATISGAVQVCLPFTSAELPTGTSASDLRVLHFDGSNWVTPAVHTVDSGASWVCTSVESLSPFVLALPPLAQLPPAPPRHRPPRRRRARSPRRAVRAPGPWPSARCRWPM